MEPVSLLNPAVVPTFGFYCYTSAYFQTHFLWLQASKENDSSSFLISPVQSPLIPESFAARSSGSANFQSSVQTEGVQDCDSGYSAVFALFQSSDNEQIQQIQPLQVFLSQKRRIRMKIKLDIVSELIKKGMFNLTVSAFNLLHQNLDCLMERSDSLMSQGNQLQKLELFVSCRNLDDLDFITVTDSYLVVKLIEHNRPEKTVLKTKVYWNDLNPNYAETVLIDFFFEIKQKLIFEVYHYESPPKLVGKVESSIGEIFGSPEHGLIRDLRNGNKKAGKIIVRCEKEERSQKSIAVIKMRADGLPNLKWWWFFGGTNAFYRIFRKRSKDELLVYESQALNTTNPRWAQFKMSQRRLASNDPSKQLQLRIYNYSSTGKHEVIGSVLFKLSQFKSGAQFPIMDKAKKKIASLVIDKFESRVQYQFGDYLAKGLQLALVNCIDFTASNGNAFAKTSLHFTGNGKSLYEKALESVTNILLDYDYDKLVPCYGFGAKIKHPKLNTSNKVHHCFPLNFDTQNPNLYKIDEIMKSYRTALPYLQFSGPTKFAELLKEAMQQCQEFKRLGTHYMILFILTDGEIHDRQEVIDLLVDCCSLPLSVIIAGIGGSDFNIMHELDDDNMQIVDSKGRKTTRDLVQFVEFQKFSNNGVSLAKEVLEELPRQVSEYFQMMNMCPQNIRDNYKEDDVARVVKFKEEMVNPYLK